MTQTLTSSWQMNVISGLTSLSSPLTLLPLILVLFLTNPTNFLKFPFTKIYPRHVCTLFVWDLESVVLLRNFHSFKCRLTSRKLTLQLEIPTIGMILFPGHFPEALFTFFSVHFLSVFAFKWFLLTRFQVYWTFLLQSPVYS